MDCHDYIIQEPERKRGQHLGQEERGAIQHLNKQGYSLRRSPTPSIAHQALL